MHDIPIILEDFLNYLDTIKGKSKNTVKEYYYDLRTFLRFIKYRYRLVDRDIEFDEIDITDVDIHIMKRINLQDLFAYISYVDKQRDNSSNTRARKVASIRSFFKYLHNIVKLIDENPAIDLETPKITSRHPSYLTLEESLLLLENIGGQFPKRDYAIIMIFLNCGLRLSELVSIDINRIKKDTLTVVGKGNKERTIYLNDSCIYAIDEYLKVRPRDGVKDPKALFLSKRKNRLSIRAVQHLVKKHLENAGLDTEKISTHKLRHTAATLMYKHGNVDIRALQQILGHNSVSTTQIYTHLDDDKLRQAVKSNPLSKSPKK
ncbi:tyrosine recombinase XerC [Clostridium sp. D2Q-11]|uniref:Tyrosine recombinase XerC n=1 Tax=Anaeromonas frigoriresistens TaxID=2683708 RepID=A0A942UYG8_9FIRM|nr:tyrosine recombinase XerC [Anaeromonas frigoriresistens]MBS4539920.1 tyrosine recombinase XerC [Anaeromonas frigoriresistens]